MILSKDYPIDSESHKKWKIVDHIVARHIDDELFSIYEEYGYNGLLAVLQEKFGITRARYVNSNVEYEFTEEQFTAFLLKWS